MNSIHQHPRTVRDGAVAAAIGVSLAMALLVDSPRTIAPAPPIETPWVMCNRVKMNADRSGWKNQKEWGVLPGWESSPGEWRTKQV